jgi:hypothetical protein
MTAEGGVKAILDQPLGSRCHECGGSRQTSDGHRRNITGLNIQKLKSGVDGNAIEPRKGPCEKRDIFTIRRQLKVSGITIRASQFLHLM